MVSADAKQHLLCLALLGVEHANVELTVEYPFTSACRRRRKEGDRAAHLISVQMNVLICEATLASLTKSNTCKVK